MTTRQKEELAILAEVWDLSPDVRLGQLMAHLGFLSEAHLGKGLGYVEDDELLAILYRHRAELSARCQETPTAVSRGGKCETSVCGSLVSPAAFSATEG